MRVSGGKRKEAGIVERFSPILLMSKSCLWLQCIGAYILPQPSKITKEPKSKAITRDKMEENQKGNKMSQNVKKQDDE